MNKKIAWSLALLIVVGAVYRIIPDRPLGFAPQIAMALFAGAVIKDKKWIDQLDIPQSQTGDDVLWWRKNAYEPTETLKKMKCPL